MKRVTSLVLSFLLLFTLCAPALAATGFVNAGTFNNHAGATFNNSGVFENSGTVSNFGSIVNIGQFRGSGAFHALHGSSLIGRDGNSFSQGMMGAETGATITGITMGAAGSSAYAEAVDVVRAIGIMETGAGAAQIITRAEGAKIAAYMMLGQSTADALTGGGTNYSDVSASHWAAGYIDYLAASGIAAEDGGRMFHPSGVMTTGAFARMMLLLLGYDPTYEGLTGEDWQINTAKLAFREGLLSGLPSLSTSRLLTREIAAQIILNTLETPMVEYDVNGTIPDDTGFYTPGYYVTSSDSAKQTISDEDWGFDYLVEFAEEYYPNLVRTLTENVVTWTYNGEPVGTYTRIANAPQNSYAKVSYQDADEITFTEAVDIVSFLSLMGETGNGAFDPQRHLTRAQGAALIARLMLDTEAANNMPATGKKFSDVPKDHWAAGYIEYLTVMGFYKAGGTFGPQTDMTGYEIMKLLIVALGCDAEIEGLNGADWQSKAANLAGEFGLLRGNEGADLSAAVTREETALYVFNALQAPIVEYAIRGTGPDVGEREYRTTPLLARQTISDKRDESGYGYLVELGEDLYSGTLTRTDNGDGTHTWAYDGKTIGTYSSSGQPVANTVSTVYLLDYASSSLDLYYSGLLLYLDGTTMEVVLTNDADALPAMKGRPVQARVVGEKQVSSGSSYVTRKTVTLTALDSVAYGEADASVAGDYAATPDQVRLNVPGSSAEIRCNLKTVFLLRYTEEDDVYVYTGLKNVPYTKMVEGTVVSAALGADGYAESVLIVNPEATRAETMLVLKKAKTAIQTAAGETYYLADVLFSGESQPRKNVAVESDCIDTLQTGVAYSAVTMNSHGRISGARPLANDRTAGGAAVGLSAAAPITYTDGTISLPDAAEGYHLAGPVTLALGPGTSLLSNQGADYEFLTLTGESLAARLDSAASYTYNYFAALNSADAQTIDSLMIWISATGG